MAPMRASLARSPPRLGRSQAGGLHPQTSRAAPPGAPSRTGPLLPRSPSRKASGHGCARWPGWSTRSVVHAGRPAPSPPEFSFSKVGQPERGQAAGLSTGGRQSLQRRRWADPGTAHRAAVHRQGGQRGCPRPERVQGGAVVQNNLIGQTFLVLHNQPAQSRASIGFQENHCIKK